jgi:hypothetical protein
MAVICVNCEGWGCAACQYERTAARGGEQGPSALEVELEQLRAEVARLKDFEAKALSGRAWGEMLKKSVALSVELDELRAAGEAALDATVELGNELNRLRMVSALEHDALRVMELKWAEARAERDRAQDTLRVERDKHILAADSMDMALFEARAERDAARGNLALCIEGHGYDLDEVRAAHDATRAQVATLWEALTKLVSHKNCTCGWCDALQRAEAALASMPAPGQGRKHARADGAECAYLADGVCNKCGWVASAPVPETQGPIESHQSPAPTEISQSIDEPTSPPTEETP